MQELGKPVFSEQHIVENARAVVTAIKNAKPEGAKGTYIKRISLSSTMGIGVRVDVAEASQ